MENNLETKPWWGYIHEDLRELLTQSVLLITTARRWESELSRSYGRGSIKRTKFHDYAFAVFPAAKAYEGFLKTLFLDLDFIREDDYYGKHFRVGKALNPSLEKEYRDRESVYDKIVEFSKDKVLADNLWQTWKECRNLLFHWFPNEKNAISLPEAEEKINMVIASIDFAYRECKINRTSNKVQRT
ncbi:hypothetical protein A3A76_00825 [Candidatus Woesebacteria bacterium RIFCSPLOWO2_01_FULL_39_23]|uniref:HEPN domain-containing protein n=1 Tax=Candidatus Woesebacteria bacterium RIFCSPHIGHO2_01_FULL_40_22 TaxID=1802499 RepID=A0A1F7YHH4_9BACT|nr:MAG: hypothetical protein A2141_05470 [Candidatus Woesebacteria bacterium RBG_16_40_11]OGM26786.1 MAG: hypothetical protein A2628_04500 [Candidatus Woesebacteria bacterium RIFCSPHIGHO2_01_FULL_40_22]OGM35750.1 MAG: hypothetical protein A3E41_03790 [Candidatus Woesebacteria bacterium RIFCSPHIGHO2_12_FULL_38_9]OGM63082.1 MAG: hypothetical protein A3A76_00825 [Candidatus Woesebacteria bacterium RIFCSPLOWO2_01_FULL_39_23]